MNHLVSMIPLAALGALEQTINALLALDPRSAERLARHQGRVVALELTGTPLTLYLQPLDEGVRLMKDYGAAADTTLRGSPFALLRMQKARPGEGMFGGDVAIEGDVELGQSVQRILQGLDIDWEEHLAHLSGDIVAHQVGNFVRGLTSWLGRSADHLEADAGEYLKYELEWLPLPEEVAQFNREVDNLREDLDRVEARVHRLDGLLKRG